MSHSVIEKISLIVRGFASSKSFRALESVLVRSSCPSWAPETNLLGAVHFVTLWKNWKFFSIVYCFFSENAYN